MTHRTDAFLISFSRRLNAFTIWSLQRAHVVPGPVLAEIAASSTDPSQRLLEALSARVVEIDATVLTAAFGTRHVALRNLIAIEMQRRGQLNDIREAAQSDASEAIRVLEYRERLRTAAAAGIERPPLPENLSYDAQHSLAVERLRGLPLEQLQQRIDWFNIENSAAYEVLATDYWDQMKDDVRL